MSSAVKILGIGLSKTGTTSLAKALDILGFNVVHYPDVERVFEIIESTDGAADTPVSMHYQELDRRYPNAKFILTVRDLDSWIPSARKHFVGRPPASEGIKELRIKLYTSHEWDEEKFVRSYLRFNEEVKEYFKDKPDKLLVYDIIGGESWVPLCRFVERPIPTEPFPHLNITVK